MGEFGTCPGSIAVGMHPADPDAAANKGAFAPIVPVSDDEPEVDQFLA